MPECFFLFSFFFFFFQLKICAAKLNIAEIRLTPNYWVKIVCQILFYIFQIFLSDTVTDGCRKHDEDRVKCLQ